MGDKRKMLNVALGARLKLMGIESFVVKEKLSFGPRLPWIPQRKANRRVAR